MQAQRLPNSLQFRNRIPVDPGVVSGQVCYQSRRGGRGLPGLVQQPVGGIVIPIRPVVDGFGDRLEQWISEADDPEVWNAAGQLGLSTLVDGLNQPQARVTGVAK